MRPPCSIPGCERPNTARGWCTVHYRRWKRHGDPAVVKPPGSPAKPRPPCIYPGCAKLATRGGRGWCRTHYTRWYRHGDPSVNRLHAPRARRDLRERILGRVIADPVGCLVWQGTALPTGYGTTQVDRRTVYVHRAIWAYQHGPIPKGMEIHHVCRNRRCVNLAHLRLLTPREHAAAHQGDPPLAWTNESVIEQIQAWHAEHGRPPRISEWRGNENGYPSPTTVIKMFGTWGEAIRAAGYEAPQGAPRGPRVRPQPPSPEQEAIDGMIGEIAERIVAEAIATFENRLRSAMSQAFQKAAPR